MWARSRANEASDTHERCGHIGADIGTENSRAPLTCFKVKLVSPLGMTITFMKIQMKFCRDLIFEPDQLFSLKKITSYPPLDTVIPKVILHSPVGVEI